MDEEAGKHDMVSISFLPLVCERELVKGQVYAERYDLAFVACSVTHQISAEFPQNIKSGGLVVAETPLFLLHLSEQVQEKFREHLKELGTRCDMALKEPEYDVKKTTACSLVKN